MDKEIGYLQTKIRENKEEIATLRKDLIQKDRQFNLLKNEFDEYLRNAEHLLESIRKIKEQFDVDKIKSMIDSSFNNANDRYIKKILKNINLRIADGKKANNEQIAESNATHFAAFEKKVLDDITYVAEFIGKDMIRMHNALLDAKIIKEPFLDSLIGLNSKYGKDVLVYIIYAEGKTKRERETGLAKKLKTYSKLQRDANKIGKHRTFTR